MENIEKHGARTRDWFSDCYKQESESDFRVSFLRQEWRHRVPEEILLVKFLAWFYLRRIYLFEIRLSEQPWSPFEIWTFQSAKEVFYLWKKKGKLRVKFK